MVPLGAIPSPRGLADTAREQITAANVKSKDATSLPSFPFMLFTNGFLRRCCTKSRFFAAWYRATSIVLRRKLVDFYQTIPNAAVSPFHDRGVTARRVGDEDGCFQVVRG